MTKSQRNLYKVLDNRYQYSKRKSCEYHKDGNELIAHGFDTEATAYWFVMQLLKDNEFLKDIADIHGVTLE